MNGEIIETQKALVSAMEPIHLGIFEGIKAYVENDVNGKGRLNIFSGSLMLIGSGDPQPCAG
jgi:hypothetical protein